jgi:synaptojanin
MGIMVFAKQRWMPFISNNKIGKKATGLAGIGGNKGGIMVSFKLHKTNFVFLNCHLAAGASQEKMKYRRLNTFDIIRSLRPFGQYIDIINGSDYFFWVGDFNFRTDAFFQDVVGWCEDALKNKNDFSRVLEHDQLKIDQKKNLSFTQMFEGAIHFKPTYRRKRDTNEVWSNKKN